MGDHEDAWPLDKALAVMKENSGIHFDPVLLDVFFDCLDEILEIRATLPD
jgi:putative two-component system response regulator